MKRKEFSFSIKNRYVKLNNREYCAISDNIHISIPSAYVSKKWSLVLKFFNERDKYQYIFKRNNTNIIHFNKRDFSVKSLSALLNILF